MIPWLRAHADAITDAFQRLLAAPVSTLLSVLAIAIALALPAGALVLLDNLQTLGNGLAGKHEISVFLGVEASRSDAAEIDRRLRALGRGEVRFVSREQALKQLQASEGLADLLAGVPRNPLPDAFVFRPARNPAGGRAADLDALARTIAGWPKVEHVQIDSTWIRRLDALLDFGRLGAAVLAAILCAGTLAIVVNTIRLQMLGRREEVELALLIGATPAFVARPFIWFGTLEGLLGAALALALVAGAMAALAGPAAELVALYGGSYALQWLTPPIAAGVLGAGLTLGWLAGRLTTVSLAARGS